MREVISTLAATVPSLAKSTVKASIRLIYPEQKGDNFLIKELGDVFNWKKGDDESKTLQECRFAIGDYLDVCIKENGSMPSNTGPTRRNSMQSRHNPMDVGSHHRHGGGSNNYNNSSSSYSNRRSGNVGGGGDHWSAPAPRRSGPDYYGKARSHGGSSYIPSKDQSSTARDSRGDLHMSSYGSRNDRDHSRVDRSRDQGSRDAGYVKDNSRDQKSGGRGDQAGGRDRSDKPRDSRDQGGLGDKQDIYRSSR